MSDYNILFANEVDKHASEAFSLNFPQIPMLNCSITELTEDYLDNHEIEYSNIDLVIGGPPANPSVQLVGGNMMKRLRCIRNTEECFPSYSLKYSF